MENMKVGGGIWGMLKVGGGDLNKTEELRWICS